MFPVNSSTDQTPLPQPPLEMPIDELALHAHEVSSYEHPTGRKFSQEGIKLIEDSTRIRNQSQTDATKVTLLPQMTKRTHRLYGSDQERLQQRLNIFLKQAGINSRGIVTIVPDKRIYADVTVTERGETSVKFFSAAVELLTEREKDFVLQHEVGHILVDYVGKDGRLKPSYKEYAAIPIDADRRAKLKLPQKVFEMMEREEFADKHAICANNTPVANLIPAVSMLAVTQNDLAGKPPEKTQDTIIQAILAGKFDDKRAFVPPPDGVHPYWIERIATLRENAKHCEPQGLK